MEVYAFDRYPRDVFRCQGYFTEFLPMLGLYGFQSDPLMLQCAGFFCLEVAHWLILGLDKVAS